MVHLKYPILEWLCFHKYITKYLIVHGSPFFKAEIWHKVEKSVPKQSGTIYGSAQIAVKDKENRVFYLNLVYELYNDKQTMPTHARTPLPPRGTNIQKKKFCRTNFKIS